jgi:transposase
MSKARDPRREQFWRNAIAGWKKSGQCIRGYCSERQLSEASFHGWRRELAKRDRSAPPDLKFLPVHVRAQAIVEVVLPNGLVVRVPAGACATTVAVLVAALRATPC